MIEITMSNSTTYPLHLDKYNAKRGDIAALIGRLGYFHLAPVDLDIFFDNAEIYQNRYTKYEKVNL